LPGFDFFVGAFLVAILPPFMSSVSAGLRSCECGKSLSRKEKDAGLPDDDIITKKLDNKPEQ
jgi:hypothetical protein